MTRRETPRSEYGYFGIALVGCGAGVGFVEGTGTAALAVAVVLSGLVLAVRALAARDQERSRQRETSTHGHWLASSLIVIVSATGGLLAAVTGTDAWFAVVLFFALVVWLLCPDVVR